MPCELCDDTGWKPLEENGVRRVVRCDCRRQVAGQQRLVAVVGGVMLMAFDLILVEFKGRKRDAREDPS